MATETVSISNQDKPGNGWRKWLLLLAVAVVLYGLGFGFASRLDAEGVFKQHRRTRKALSLFYSPIIWTDRHTPLREPIEAYVQLWLPAPSNAK